SSSSSKEFARGDSGRTDDLRPKDNKDHHHGGYPRPFHLVRQKPETRDPSPEHGRQPDGFALFANAHQPPGESAKIERRGWQRGEITLFAILGECLDSTLYLARARAATPAISQMLFDL